MILYYRDRMLPHSQTFVLAQGEAVRRHEVRYLGLQHVHDGLPTPPERTTIAFRGRFAHLREVIFRETGRSAAVDAALRAIRPSLVHAHFLYDAAHILPACIRSNLPLIVTEHGWAARPRHDGHVTRAYLRRRQQLWRYASRVICVSEALRLRLVGLGCPEALTEVHYIGVDTTLFAPRRNGGPAPPPTIVFVGRLVPIKGCREMLAAAAIVRRSQPNLRVVIAGWGPEEPVLRQLASELLPGACAFLGACDPARVREALAQARVLCVPAIPGADGTEEALGMVHLEAQAMGLPVVSTRVGGVPEAVMDGKTGLLCPSAQPEELAVALAVLLSDDVVWRRMSEAARGHVLARFDLARQTIALEAIYDSVLSAAR